jgi:hypothetical protein
MGQGVNCFLYTEGTMMIAQLDGDDASKTPAVFFAVVSPAGAELLYAETLSASGTRNQVNLCRMCLARAGPCPCMENTITLV